LLNNALQLPGLIRRGSWNFLAAATTTHAAAVWTHSLSSLLHHIPLLSALQQLQLMLLVQSLLFLGHSAATVLLSLLCSLIRRYMFAALNLLALLLLNLLLFAKLFGFSECGRRKCNQK
jgi:hypothetical protein